VLLFLLGRLGQAALTLLLVSIAVFAIGRMTGNPADLLLSPEASATDRAAFIARLGLDRPLPQQYLSWLLDGLRGDFGTSMRTGAPAAEIVLERLPASLKLASAGVAFAILLSLPLGILAAVRKDRAWDRAALGIALLGQSIPTFWLAIGGVLVFGVWLRWLPTSGIGGWRHYVMPAIVMGWGMSAGIVRLLRSAMLEVLDSEFIRLARAKGVSEPTIVLRHALRNALIPVVTFIGFMYGIVIASAVVVEVVFAWPGLGTLAYEATLWRDFPVLQLCVLTYTAIIIVINLLVDLSYALIDPRIRTA
jgi:peptide/nickel transport system permease protein